MSTCNKINTPPLVSIVMPVYNGEQYLSEAIDSAIAQTYQNWELIIVNDGSTDNSESIVKNYLDDPRIHYIKQHNRGVAAARNTAIASAKGTYIGFLDQDDRWHSNKLATQVQALEADETLALVYARQNIINKAGETIDYNWPTGASGHCFKALFLRNQITILTTLLRKQVLDETGVFNEELAGTDDYDMWLRICINKPISFIDQPLADYRLHDSNVSNDDFKMTVRDLQTIDSVLRLHPEIYQHVGKQLVRTRLYQLNNELGGWYSWQAKDYKQARHHYARAIGNKRSSIRLYFKWLYCTLSKQQRQAYDWYSHKLRGVFHK